MRKPLVWIFVVLAAIGAAALQAVHGRPAKPHDAPTPIEAKLRMLQELVNEKLDQLESANELAATGMSGRVSEALGDIVYDVTPAVNELVHDAEGTPVENDVQEVRAEVERLAETAKRINRTPAELQSGFNSLQIKLLALAEKAKAF